MPEVEQTKTFRFNITHLMHTYSKWTELVSYHRIIEQLGLEGTSRITKLQHSCHRQGCQPPHLILDQAISTVYPSLFQTFYFRFFRFKQLASHCSPYYSKLLVMQSPKVFSIQNTACTICTYTHTVIGWVGLVQIFQLNPIILDRSTGKLQGLVLFPTHGV